MKKYLLGFLALSLAIGFSSFTGHKSKFTAQWYKYNPSAPQTKLARESAANYDVNTAGDPGCTGTIDECGVEMPSNQGSHPNFTGVSFDAVNGYPIVDGTKVLGNELLQ